MTVHYQEFAVPVDPEFTRELKAQLDARRVRQHWPPKPSPSDDPAIQLPRHTEVTLGHEPVSRPDRSWRRGWLLAAAVVAVLVAGTVLVLATSDDDSVLRPAATLPPESSSPTTVAPPSAPSDRQFAAAVALTPDDWGPNYEFSRSRPYEMSRELAESLPECVPFLDTVFESPGRPATVTTAIAMPTHNSPTVSHLQYVVVFADVAEAEAMMDALHDPRYPECDARYRNEWAVMGGAHDNDFGVGVPPQLDLAGDDSVVVNVTRRSRGGTIPFVRVGRTVMMFDAYRYDDDELVAIVARAVERVKAADAGAPLAPASVPCGYGPAALEPPFEDPSPPKPQATAGGTLSADYRFENSLASSAGTAPDLTEVGEGAVGFVDEAVFGQTRDVLTFDRGSGLELAPTAGVINSGAYTIELLFRFDRLDGWRKIIDFNNATSDCGLYSLDGGLNFFPTPPAFGAPIDADSYVQVVLTRDASGTVVGYANGARQFSFHDTDGIAVIDTNDTVRFFIDDTDTNGEHSGGAVSRIRLYDGPLTGDEVAALAAELPIERPTMDEAVAGVEALLREEAAADRFSGAVLVTKQGQVVFSHAVGLADRQSGIPNTLQTRFRVGSMNKMFTAVAILQLVEAGNIELTAPVGDYLADYPNRDVANRVTIHHLLTHTGGTGDIFGPTFDVHRTELRTHNDYLELYGERDLAFDPGSSWAYSNYGFVLLGAVIEEVTGQTYYDYVHEHIYEPAGMTATGSLPEDEEVPGRSIGYTGRPGASDRVPNTDTLPYRGTSSGGGYSTVEDLNRFAEALLSHQLLGPNSTDLLFNAKVESGPGNGYAYGFEDYRDGDGNGPVGHGGSAPGMNGDLRIYPKSGYVVVVLANIDPPAAGRISSYLAPRLPQQ